MSTTTTLLGPAEIRELAERAGVRPTKQLGQNFVLDDGEHRHPGRVGLSLIHI